PEEWRDKVCKLLRTENPSILEITFTAQQRFDANFPGSWLYELYSAFRNTLKNEIRGCPISMNPPPPGITWEFFFQFKGKKTYGKILLRTDKEALVIHSAHLPEKAKLSCER